MRQRNRLNHILWAAFALYCLPALAVDKFWRPPPGATDLDWNNAVNWDPDGVPTNEASFIDGARTINITTTPISPIHRFYPGGTFDHGNVTDGTATVNHTAGDVRVVGPQSWMVIADKPTPTGTASTYNLSGGSLFIEEDFMTVGQNGTGVLNVSGTGSINTRGLIFGRWAVPGHGTGTLKDQGSIITRTGGFTVGDEGIGVFTQSGGSVSVGQGVGGYDTWAFIGGHDRGVGPRTGTYNMEGGTFTSQERIQISQGLGSTGTFNQTGGDVSSGLIEVGHGGIGTYNLSNGTVTTRETVVVGAWHQGDGRLNVSGGTMNIGQALLVSRASTDVLNRATPVGGTVTQTGGVINTAWAEIGTNKVPGETHVGRYKMVDGALNLLFEMNLGRNFGDGIFEMEGGTVTVGQSTDPNAQKSFHVGRGGARGTLIMSGGNIFTPAAFLVASVEGGPPNVRMGEGTVTQTGGTITAMGFVSIGQHGKATYSMSGGTITTPGDFNVGDVVAAGFPGSDGTFNLSGTALAEGSRLFVGKAGGTKGVVNQTGGTFKAGPGGVLIAQDAGSTGTYNLGGGTLDGVNGSSLLFGAGTAAFNMTGGELKNFGIIGFSLNNRGGRLVLADRGTVGFVSTGGDYTQGATAGLDIDIQSQSQYDSMLVGGNVALDGNLSITREPTFEPTVGTTFDIVTGNALTGRFATITGNEAGPLFRFAPRYTATTAQLVVAIAGDTNLDHRVNFADFQRLERNFGLSGTWSEGDFNGDGTVNFSDFQFLYANFGESFTPMPGVVTSADQATLDAFAAAHVPEPGLTAVGALAIACALARRRTAVGGRLNPADRPGY